MKKIIINTCYGGFSLSKEAYNYLGLEWDEFGYMYEDKRDDIKLVECIKELGKKANGSCASLKIVEIPDGVDWRIEEYDGLEQVVDVHRIWR